MTDSKVSEHNHPSPSLPGCTDPLSILTKYRGFELILDSIVVFRSTPMALSPSYAKLTSLPPAAFPLSGNRRLVAPFWADVDIRKNGQVFYRENASDPRLLQQATVDVTNTFVDHRKFKATWVFVVTWYEVPFFGASGNNINKVREQIKKLFY